MADKLKRKVATTTAADRPQKKSKKTVQDQAKSDPGSTPAGMKSTPAIPQNDAAVKSKASRKRAADFLDGETATTETILPQTTEVTSKKPKKARSEPLASAASKKGKKSKATAMDASLTADGVNGVIEHSSDSEVEITAGGVSVKNSLTAEGLRTAEKEISNEFGKDDSDDEDVDQGAALLAGFDSDVEDNAEDTGLDLTRTMPIPDYKKTSKKLRKAKEAGSDGPGTVYVGRIPHGFYEQPMKDYFSQFGDIRNLRLSRNRKTGASKHFAFIEFESNEVAKIVAETMDNYLMFGHILKCKYAPTENLHPDLWKGANKRFRKIPHDKLERQRLEAPKTVEQWTKKNKKEQSKREKQAEKMKAIGYEYNSPSLQDPVAILGLRQLEQAKQPVEEVKSIDAAPATTEEPADKKSKKSKKAKNAVATAVAPLTASNLDHQNADNALESATKDANIDPPVVQSAPKTSTVAATDSASAKGDETSTKKKKRRLSQVLSESTTLDKGDYDALSSIAVGAEPVPQAPEEAPPTSLNELGNTVAGVADAELKKRKKDRKSKKDATSVKSNDEKMADQAAEVAHDKAVKDRSVKSKPAKKDDKTAPALPTEVGKSPKGILKKDKKPKA